MAIALDPGKTAILCHGLQKDFMVNTAPSVVAVQNMLAERGAIPKMQKLIAEARRTGMSVVMIQHLKRPETEPPTGQVMHRVMFMLEGTPGADFIDELKPTPEDHVVQKRRASAFYQTDLELRLRCAGVKTLIVIGSQSEVGILSTVTYARDRDFDVVVVRDCCASRSKEDEEYMMEKYFPVHGKVTSSEELLAAMQQLPSK